MLFHQQWKRRKLLAVETSKSGDFHWGSPTRNRYRGTTSTPHEELLLWPPNTWSRSPRVGDSGSRHGGHRQSFDQSRSSSVSTMKKLYLTRDTLAIMRREVELTLPFPATVANVALLLRESKSVQKSFLEDVTTDHFVSPKREDLAVNYSTTSNNTLTRISRNWDYDGNDDDDDLLHGLTDSFSSSLVIQRQCESVESRRRQNKLQLFQDSWSSFISTGNNTWLNSWQDLLNTLRLVFTWQPIHEDEDDNSITLSSEEGREISDTLSSVAYVVGDKENDTVDATTVVEIAHPLHHGLPTLSEAPTQNLKVKQFSPKSIPKKARPSPLKAALTQSRRQSLGGRGDNTVVMMEKKSSSNTDFLSLKSYRRQIQKKIGAYKWNQIFHYSHQLTSITTDDKVSQEKSISIADTLISRLDKLIQEKEDSLRTTAEIDSILTLKEAQLHAEQRTQSLLRPLSQEEQSIVREAIYGIGPTSDILASLDADSIQRGSMHRLQPGQWLNDEVINYFLKNCLARRDEKLCVDQPGRRRSHFFNSFFVQSLFDEKNSNLEQRGKYTYKNVKRWSKKVPGKDVFGLKYIVCPINLDNLHWTSAVIFMEEKKIQYYDSLGGTEMDKLRGLLQYLKDEYKAKMGEEMDDSEWRLVGCTKDTPRQLNGYDCGVFTCMFCDFISLDCALTFTQEHVNQCRERIALSIMKNCAIE